MNRRVSYNIALCAMMSAMLTVGKLALSWLANVEIVTVLIVVFVLSFGLKRCLVAINCFIITEIALYPAQIWILCYVIHFNLLAVIVWLVGLKTHNSLLLAIPAAVLTVLFGVQTTAFEILVGAPAIPFLEAFAIRYVAGISFFTIHIISSFATVLILTPILLPPLAKLGGKANNI